MALAPADPILVVSKPNLSAMWCATAGARLWDTTMLRESGPRTALTSSEWKTTPRSGRPTAAVMGRPFSTRAMCTAQSCRPVANSLVPSRGSIIQTRFLPSARGCRRLLRKGIRRRVGLVRGRVRSSFGRGRHQPHRGCGRGGGQRFEHL